MLRIGEEVPELVELIDEGLEIPPLDVLKVFDGFGGFAPGKVKQFLSND